MENVKEERLSVAENGVLTEVFGSKIADVTRDRRKLHNCKPYDGTLRQILL